MDFRKIVYGMISGFFTAVMVDLDAWKSGDDAPFDWGKALRRWVKGIIVGAMAGFGVSQIPVPVTTQ